MNNKPLSAELRVQEFLQQNADKMQWYRDKAAEYLKAHPRRKFYKVDYHFGVDNTVYVNFTDEEVKRIQDLLAKVVAEEGPFNNDLERMDAISCIIDELDIDWAIRLEDEHAFYGETINVTDINLDDFVFCNKFTVKRTEWYKEDKEDLSTMILNLVVTDDELIELIAFKLADPKLTFLDVRLLDKALYERIDDQVYRVHECHLIYLTEVSETANAIAEAYADDDHIKHRLLPLSSLD